LTAINTNTIIIILGQYYLVHWCFGYLLVRRKLQLFGHVCRMSDKWDDRLLKALVLGMVEGKRQPGRNARRWIDNVLMWCGKDIKGAVMMTEGRDNWRRFVSTGQHLRSPWPRDSKKKKKKGMIWLLSDSLLTYLNCVLKANTTLQSY